MSSKLSFIGSVSSLLSRNARQTVAMEMILANNAQINGRSAPAFLPASIIGKQAEYLASVLKDGDTVSIEGELRQENWESVKEGVTVKNSRVKVHALRVDILDLPGAETITDTKGNARIANGVNSVGITGNLTSSPVQRRTAEGKPVATISVAVNNKYTTRSGEVKEEVTYLEVVAWDTLAAQAMTFHKGDKIIVTGAIISESWTDRDGNKRQALKVEAERIFKGARQEKAEVSLSEPQAAD